MRNSCLTILACLALAVQAQAQSVSDPGFEVPAIGAGKFAYRPAGSAWSFSGTAGLAGNASGFTSSNPVAPQASQVAILQGASLVTQTIPGWPAGSYQISFRAAQRNYPATGSSQVINVLVDGRIVSSIQPGTVAYQQYFTSAFSVPAGAHTLGFQGASTTGDNTAFLDAVAIIPSGSVPARIASTAFVASSGKMIGFSFQGLTDGKPATPLQILAVPTISVNGQPLGQLGQQWCTGYHPIALLATPGSYQIRPGDVVRVSGPLAWANTPGGFTQALEGVVAENRAGKPMLATESLPRTLRIGVNNNQAPTSSGLGFYFPFRNLKYRVAWPPFNRGKFAAPPWTLPVDNHTMANGIDATKYPGTAGLWCVMWDAANPQTPVQFAISTATPAQCTVTERVDLARAPADGIGCCRVFDVQPIPGLASADFDVSLSYTDPGWTGKPNYANLWVCQPGDFELSSVGGSNNAVVLDRTDPWSLSKIYLDRVGPNVGSMRWVDSTVTGGNPASCPYPEFLPSLSDESWGDLAFYGEIRGYTSAGPVDMQATPWIYSPFFRQTGQSFTATLAADITTAPAPGTRETWTFTDADTAPLMVGLEIRAGDEVCRIIAGSGQQWQVYRGSSGTVPATHAAGPVSVSGRMPITSVLSAGGMVPKGLTVQLTTATPHNRTTGNVLSCDGGGWPTISYTDGSSWNLQGFGRQVYVTGPTTAFMVVGSSGAGGVPKLTYPLAPKTQQWYYRSNAGIPIEATAIATARFPHADLHVNVPPDACDDMVFEIARRVLANFPAGRRVYVEYSNEPWNWAFTGFYYHSGVMGPLCVPGNPYQLAHYAMRAGQVQAIFRTVFGNAARGPEIQGLVNCQMGSGDSQVKPYLEYGLKLGTPFDVVAVAPYWSLENTAYNRAVAGKLDDEQLIDVIGADQRMNPRTNNPWMTSIASAVAGYNQAHQASVKLIGYEGGVEFADPWDMPRNHDLIYSPNWYFAELDWLAWCQQAGFDRLNIYNHAMWWAPHGWGGYHTMQQRHSRGDGMNGAARNLDWRARGKDPHVNQDLHVDAVRPQAWLDWLGTLRQ